MKTTLLATLLLTTTSLSAHALQQCDFDGTSLQYVSFGTLPDGKITCGGALLSGSYKECEEAPTAQMLRRSDLTFKIRGSRYHVYRDASRGWRLEAFENASGRVSYYGPAYCK